MKKAFFLFFGLVFVSFSVLSYAEKVNPTEHLSSQQADLARTYSTGLNRKPCLNILRGIGGGGKLLPWAQIFNPGYWIPVVPDECVVCIENDIKNNPIINPSATGAAKYKYGAYPTPTIVECPGGDGGTVPLPVNLIPHIAIRLYGLIASISMYLMILVVAIIGLRYLVNGLAKSGNYMETTTQVRKVTIALIITMVSATVFLQILFAVFQIPKSQFEVYQACIPTTSKEVKSLGGTSGDNTDDFCEVHEP